MELRKLTALGSSQIDAKPPESFRLSPPDGVALVVFYWSRLPPTNENIRRGPCGVLNPSLTIGGDNCQVRVRVSRDSALMESQRVGFTTDRVELSISSADPAYSVQFNPH